MSFLVYSTGLLPAKFLSALLNLFHELMIVMILIAVKWLWY